MGRRVKIFGYFDSSLARLYNSPVPKLIDLSMNFNARFQEMSKIRVISAILLAAAAGLITYSNVGEQFSQETPEIVAAGKPTKTMRPFRSAEELKDFFKKLAEQQRRDAERGGSREIGVKRSSDSGRSATRG
jgi:hypothetical protein